MKRLRKFKLELEPSKTRLIEFGRFASRHAKEKRKETRNAILSRIYTLLYEKPKGNFMVGRKTEKNRLKRSIGKVQETMRTIRHGPIKDQAKKINQILRGHYAYYGMAGNIRCLIKVYQVADTLLEKNAKQSKPERAMLLGRSSIRLRSMFPLMRPKIFIPFSD